MITTEELHSIMPFAGARCNEYAAPLNAAMKRFEIDNPLREAAFIAQIAHESGSLHFVKELASGGAYEGRKDLGNTEPGDGIFFKGRGLIQITGRHNYSLCGLALELDLLEHPELLELPENACLSAAWFWNARKLNELADKPDFLSITRRINGGTNGYQSRLDFYERAKKVLGLED